MVRCEVCKYFDHNDGIYGDCRFNPPIPFIHEHDERVFFFGQWPKVKQNKSCGKGEME